MTEDIRLLVCGSRDFIWTDQILYAIDRVKPVLVIEGDCRGADRIAADCAFLNFVNVLPVPADWDKYGKAAGPIRNAKMLEQGKPNLVIGFTDNFLLSRGTGDMMAQARNANIMAVLFDGGWIKMFHFQEDAEPFVKRAVFNLNYHFEGQYS